MSRFLQGVLVTLGVLALIVGGGVVAARAGLIGPPVARAYAEIGPFHGELPAELQWAKDLSPSERFGHFLGAQMKYKDANNQTHTASMTPGTVTEVSSSALKIKANEDGSIKTYNLTSETRVHGGPQQWGATLTPKAGDQVVVATLDNSSDARGVMIRPADGFHHFGPRGR